MAVTDKEKEKVQAFFEAAQTEGRLELIEVEEVDVLYHYSEWPAVLRVVKPEGVELWAAKLNNDLTVAGAIQVGTQDKFGRNNWLSGVKSGR